MKEVDMKQKKIENIDASKGAIVIYKARGGAVRLDVRLEKETVWLNQADMANLFNKTVPTVNEHLKNIYHEGELDRKSTIRKFRIVQIEGKRRIERDIEYYNLDVIISVGYRVKSLSGTQFRIWATNVLKGYIVKGYALNQKRLLYLSIISRRIDILLKPMVSVRSMIMRLSPFLYSSPQAIRERKT